jgi:hypothetical protein
MAGLVGRAPDVGMEEEVMRVGRSSVDQMLKKREGRVEKKKER